LMEQGRPAKPAKVATQHFRHLFPIAIPAGIAQTPEMTVYASATHCFEPNALPGNWFASNMQSCSPVTA
jgi:hypothetical protein